MNDKILSVIIPSYNMEKYLAKALESILGIEDTSVLDVIVVNDGSKDKTLDVAVDYERRYPGIVTIVDKANGNYGSCINAGLKIAEGKYVKILDADDSFITDGFCSFVEILKKTDADLFFSDYVKWYGPGDIEHIKYALSPNKLLSAVESYEIDAFKEIQMPAITYRTTILRKIYYYQTEGISYTDMEWCFSPISQVNTIYYFNRPVYSYFLSRDGQTMDPTVQINRFSHVLMSLSSILNVYSELDVDKSKNDYLVSQIVRHLRYVYQFYLIDHKETDRSELRKFDSLVEFKCPQAYIKSGEFEYRKKIRYRYVDEWRTGSHEYIPKGILLKERVLDFLGRLHVKIVNIRLKRKAV